MLVTETVDVPSLVVIAGAATKKNKLYKRDKCNSENIKKGIKWFQTPSTIQLPSVVVIFGNQNEK